MDFGVAAVASITALCYFIGEVVKVSAIDNKWIPVVCGFFGILLGIGAYQVGIQAMPADDIITAAAVGVASGFAATGVNQVYKQLSSDDSEQ